MSTWSFGGGGSSGGGGVTHTRKTVTTGLINGNTFSGDHYYDEDLGLNDIVIEHIEITRTLGTAESVAVLLYDDDPTGAGTLIANLIGEEFTGFDATTGVAGPVSGQQIRAIAPVPAGAWIRVVNDTNGVGALATGGYSVTIDHRPRQEP